MFIIKAKINGVNNFFFFYLQHCYRSVHAFKSRNLSQAKVAESSVLEQLVVIYTIIDTTMKTLQGSGSTVSSADNHFVITITVARSWTRS